MIKSAEEIAWFEKGGEFTDRTMAAIARTARPGLPDYGLSGPMQSSFLDDGGTLMFHYLGSTPMDDPEIIFPFQYPSARVMRRGDILMTEVSAGYWGYTGQIQRPFAIGAAPTPTYQRLYDVALEAYESIFAALKPGNTDADIRAAAAVIEASDFHTHDILLHGWGVTIEPPRVDLPSAAIKRELTPFTVQPGMLLVIQPHIITADGKRGVQLGNLVVIEKDGPRSLQKADMSFIQV